MQQARTGDNLLPTVPRCYYKNYINALPMISYFFNRRGSCWLLLCAVLLDSGALHAAERPRLLALLSDAAEVYSDAMKGAEAALRTAATTPYTLDIQALADAPADLGADLILTIGVRAAQEVVARDTQAPVLSILIPQTTFAQLSRDAAGRNNSEAGRRSAIFIDQPFTRQLDFCRALLPYAGTAGVMLGPSSSTQLDALRSAATARSLALRTSSVADGDQLAAGIGEVLTGSDFVLAVPDAAVLTSTQGKWLVYMAYRARIPVIGFSKAYVNAGALAAVFSTPEQIGRQAGEWMARWLRRRVLQPPAHPEYYSVAVNAAVARALGTRVFTEGELLRQLMETERSRHDG